MLLIMDLCEDDTSYETENWTSMIDRGGLFHVSETTYTLIHAMEEEVCDHLRKTPAHKIVDVPNVSESSQTTCMQISIEAIVTVTYNILFTHKHSCVLVIHQVFLHMHLIQEQEHVFLELWARCEFGSFHQLLVYLWRKTWGCLDVVRIVLECSL